MCFVEQRWTDDIPISHDTADPLLKPERKVCTSTLQLVLIVIQKAVIPSLSRVKKLKKLRKLLCLASETSVHNKPHKNH
jgi:hypothetical protein